MNLLPIYNCFEGESSEICTRHQTCEPGVEFEIKTEGAIYLHNWIEDLNLRCVENWKIGMFGSIFFMGHVMGSVFLAGYGDTYGRIYLMRVGQGVSLVAYIWIVYFSRNLLVIYTLLFVVGLLSCWRLSLSYIYGQEIVASNIQNLTGSFFNLYDATIMI